MAQPIGGVTVDLQADAAIIVREMERASRAVATSSQKAESSGRKFSSSLNRMQSQAQRAATGIRRSFSALSRIALPALGIGALGGGVAIAGLARLAKQAAETADVMVKTSDRVGLSVKAYQALELQVRQTGGNVESLGRGLEAFGRRVALARGGTGPLVSGLKELNPELVEAIANARNQEEALRLVADAMAATEDITVRLAIADAAFTSSNRALAKSFATGSKGIDEYRQLLDRLGFVTEANARSAEGMNDSLDSLSTTIRTRVSNALLRAAPAIQSISDQFVEMGPEIESATEAIVDFADRALEELRKRIETTRREFEALKSVFDAVRDFGSGLAALFKADQVAISKRLFPQIGDSEAFNAAVERSRRLIQEAGTASEAAAAATATIAEEASDAADQEERLAAAAERAAEQQERLAGLTATVASKPPLVAPVPAARPDIAGPPTLEQAREAGDLEPATEAARRIREAQQEAFQEAEFAAARFQFAAEDAMLGVLTGSEDAGEAVQGLARRFRDLVLELLIIRPLAEAVSRSLSGAFGGAAAGGGFLANIFKQHGGPVSQGMPYIVGEAGPELFVPGSSGSVLPNGVLQNMEPAGGGVRIDVGGISASGGATAEMIAVAKATIWDMVPAIEGAISQRAKYDPRFRGNWGKRR